MRFSFVSPLTLWRTLRHLRARQLKHQVLLRLLPQAGMRRRMKLRWRLSQPRVLREKNISRTFFDGRSGFSFNNEAREFSGWNDPGARKLWLYNLHYMTWLFDLPAGEREAWMLRWIRENSRGLRGNGWEPYPLSLRLFNWAKHYALTGGTPDGEVLASFEEQASWLLDHLEFHLDGNHLLENLFALALVGFFLDTADPGTLKARRKIQHLLEDALGEQFLPDGGHYELSPMYHAVLLERLLDLLNLWPASGDPYPGLQQKLRLIAHEALDWLDTMSVGGRFALFNDSAYDTAPEASLLLEYGTRLLDRAPASKTPLKALEASGYYRAEAGPWTLIFDAGRLGPDRQPGHAQGDMLSFCLWLRGFPLIVHPGNFEYVAGEMRDYCRSTASHNTLVIEGAEQAEWWGSHRIGWRGRPREASSDVDASANRVRLRGAHDAYTRLPGSPLHAREVEVSEDRIVVQDLLTADTGREARAYLHFHPECSLELQGEDRISVKTPAGIVRVESDQRLHIEDSWYSPEFGMKIRNKALYAKGMGRNFRVVLILESPV